MHGRKQWSLPLVLATSAILFVAPLALGQVDWGDLFPEEGRSATKPASAPAARARQNLEQPPQHPQQVVKPAPAVSHHTTRPKPARRVAARSPSQSEFPAAAAAAPQFDHHSQRRSSPPPSAVEAATATGAVEENQPITAPAARAPEQATAKAQPAPAPVVAAREPEPPQEAATVRAKIEQPATHESATAANEPEPAVQPNAANRAARAAAAQQAKPRALAEAAAPSVDTAPVQVAAASAESAMTGNRRSSASTSSSESMSALGLKVGDVITEGNMQQYASLLTPGLEWVLRYGLRMKVVAPRQVTLNRLYREATEKYAGQVKVSPDGRRVVNYTAGQPFPNVDPNDPLAAQKLMWNFSYAASATDDLNAENFDADTGAIGKNRPMTVERHYLIDNLRRLFYTGRLVVDPKPTLPNPDDVRFKESLHPLSEPFDLKGVGGTFYRYNDADRQDDSWLYLPQLRRVRRLSSAQRSDALFGQDIDIDSYYGYNGHVGWADWKFLGERTVLAVMHGQNSPVKWQEPEDWVYDDVWEPRQVYVIEANSKLAQYAYGKRVIYLDKEATVVTHSDIYDRAGQLWKVVMNDFSFKKEAIPGAQISRYPDEMAFQHAIVMIDTQLVHATKASLPSTHTPGQECIYFNMGAKSGTSEDFFTVANLVESGH